MFGFYKTDGRKRHQEESADVRCWQFWFLCSWDSQNTAGEGRSVWLGCRDPGAQPLQEAGALGARAGLLPWVPAPGFLSCIKLLNVILPKPLDLTPARTGLCHRAAALGHFISLYSLFCVMCLFPLKVRSG